LARTGPAWTTVSTVALAALLGLAGAACSGGTDVTTGGRSAKTSAAVTSSSIDPLTPASVDNSPPLSGSLPTAAAAIQPALSAQDRARAEQLWPGVRQDLARSASRRWIEGPTAIGFLPVPLGVSDPNALHVLGVDAKEPFDVWVVKGIVGESGGAPGAIPAPPTASRFWLVARKSGVGLVLDYPERGARPGTTGFLPTPREELRLT